MNKGNGKVIVMGNVGEAKNMVKEEPKKLTLLDYYDAVHDCMVFHVRPFTEQMTEELEENLKMLSAKDYGVVATKKDGVYTFKTDYLVTPGNFFESSCEGMSIGNMWGMLFRRYSAAAHDTLVEQMTEKRYYKVVVSNEFIESSDRVYAA